MAADISVMLSRNSVPVRAASNRPTRSLTAVGNAPRTWPNSADSRCRSVIPAQLRERNGRSALGPCAWRARATSSLPVPLSPRISTGADPGAACDTCLYSCNMLGDRPIIVGALVGTCTGVGLLVGGCSARSTVALSASTSPDLAR